MLVDSHCHLNFPDLASRMDDVRANMAANAVSHALLIGVNRPDYPAVRAPA
jgi:TatD DNase family protein